MKWYNYDDLWVDISKCYGVSLDKTKIMFVFSGNDCDSICFDYKNKQERDAEFEKIKALMGIKDYTSRCC